MTNNTPMCVQLGPHWKEFTHGPGGLHFLGIVRQGQQVGALARTYDGSYVQVNGDYIDVLDQEMVIEALQQSGSAHRDHPKRDGGTRSAAATTAPIVIVKKRRLLSRLA